MKCGINSKTGPKSLVLILTWSKRDAKKSISSFAFVCGESMTRHVTFFSNLWEFLSGWFGLELFPLIMPVLRFSLGPLCCCFTKRCLSWVASDFVWTSKNVPPFILQKSARNRPTLWMYSESTWELCQPLVLCCKEYRELPSGNLRPPGLFG